MMEKTRQQLQERGELLEDIGDRSEQMEMRSSSFAEKVAQLRREQEKKSKWSIF